MIRKIVLTTTVLMACFLCQTAFAKSVNYFSATQVALDASGNVQNKGKVFVSKDRMRLEMKAPQGEGQWVIIFRQDLNKHWMLNPDKKLYYERPYDEEEMRKATKSFKGKEKVLGKETVNGYKCIKKEVVSTVTVMGFTQTSTSTIWHSERLNMPIRTRSKHGGTELRDIVEKKPGSKLFELPSGYEKVDNMFAFFGSFKKSKEDSPEEEPSDMPQGMMDKLKGFKLPFGK